MQLLAVHSTGVWLECIFDFELRRDSQDPTRKNPSYLDDLLVWPGSGKRVGKNLRVLPI